MVELNNFEIPSTFEFHSTLEFVNVIPFPGFYLTVTPQLQIFLLYETNKHKLSCKG